MCMNFAFVVYSALHILLRHLSPSQECSYLFPKGDGFKDVLNGFSAIWGFPHCAGAIDGSHIPQNKRICPSYRT